MQTLRKFRWSLVSIGLFLNYVTSAAVSSEEQATEAPSALRQPQLNVTTTTGPFQLQIPFRTCYVGESKALKLMVQMSSVLRMLNSDQDYVDSKLTELNKLPDLQKYEMCSDQRIEQLTVELGWVSRRLWELSIRLEEPKDAEVQLLDKRKIDLIRHLQNLVVFTGGSSTPSSAMQLESFGVKVEYLEYGFNTALVMFQTDRPRRPNPSPGRFLKNAIIQSILEPSKSTIDLIEMSRYQPDAMSEALPQLVSNWYDRKLVNVQIVLDFIKRLPKVVHQMIGYAELYDAMSANYDLESYELTQFVLQLKGMNASVTSASAADISRSVLAKYTQLLEDVMPVYQIVGTNTSCNFRNLKYTRSIGSYSLISLYSSESSTEQVAINSVSGTAMFTPSVNQWYASGSDVFSASKRSVKYRSPVSELFGQWKLVPVKGGKYFRILNAKYNEVLFADKAEMYSSCCRRLFLARHDYPFAHDYEQGADLWTIDCN